MKGLNKIAFLIGGIVSIFLIVSVVSAHGNNLWEHFEGKLPSLSDRAIIYNKNFPDTSYNGFVEQNIRLHSVLDGELKLGALAFPPSTVEGTSTAGWTDDGSNVRLNTAADFVGIGTSNPAEKLTVTGGNFQLNGDIIMSGGDFTFGSTNSGTSTLTVANSGRLGVGTTTPRATFSVGGAVMVSGTTTTGGLNATNTATSNLSVTGTTQFNTVAYSWPSADGSSGQVLRTDGSGVLTWIAQSTGAITLIVSSSTPIATSTMSFTGLTLGTDVRVVVDIPGSDNDNVIMRFNLDNGANYGSSVVTGYNATPAQQQAQTFARIGGDDSTTTARFLDVRITNRPSQRKRMIISGSINMGTPATYAGTYISGTGIWNNTSGKITAISIQMGTLTNNLNASTTVRIYSGDN